MGQTGPVAWLQDLLQRRPAESTTAAAGALGLLVAVLLGNGSNDFRTGLIVLLAALPSVVSRLYDLGRFGADGRRIPRDVNRELEDFALRTVRRARRRHPYWQRDAEALQLLSEIRGKVLPVERAPIAQTGATSGGAPTTDPPGAAGPT